jgi:GT2 family glycosyltransferase
MERLVRSLEQSTTPLRGMVVVDNADDGSTAEVLAASRIDCRRVVPGRNLGCAGGLALGGKEAAAMFAADYTHLWILDDDAEVEPDTLATLLDAMAAESAWASIPLVVDENGQIDWFPHIKPERKFTAIRQKLTPAEFRERCGAEPALFTWSTGVSLLVAREAVEKLGYHRDDYWIRGEDLEYSLRLTCNGKGILVPTAVVKHLPPPVAGATDTATERYKHAAMIRNLAFTSFRLRHGRSLIRRLPGNCLRFVRTWGASPAVLAMLASALWRGAILGLPAGADPERPEPAR